MKFTLFPFYDVKGNCRPGKTGIRAQGAGIRNNLRKPQKWLVWAILPIHFSQCRSSGVPTINTEHAPARATGKSVTPPVSTHP
jgi:hypothetical protein